MNSNKEMKKIANKIKKNNDLYKEIESIYNNEIYNNDIYKFKSKFKLYFKAKEIEMSHLTTLGFLGAIFGLIFKDFIQDLFKYLNLLAKNTDQVFKFKDLFKQPFSYLELIVENSNQEVISNNIYAGIIGILGILGILVYIIIKKKDDYFAKKCLYIINEIDSEQNKKIARARSNKYRKRKT